MKIFSYGEFSKKLIYPFLMAFSVFLLSNTREIIRKFTLTTLSNGEQLKFTHHPFYMTWLCYFSKLIFVVLVFIQKRKLNNKEKTEGNLEKEKIKLIDPTQSLASTKTEYKEEESIPSFQAITGLPRKAKIKLILLFIGLHLCEGSAITASFAVKEIELTFLELIIRGLLILFTMFFSMKILKYKYSKHHFFGISFIILGIFTYSLCECLNISGKKVTDVRAWISYILIIFLVQIVTALQECIEKYMMDYKYISPYFILSVEGVIGFVVQTLSLIIVSNLVYCQNTNYYCYRNPDNDYRAEDFIYTSKLIFSNFRVVICIIGLIIFYFFFDLFRIKTNQIFSPTHRSIGDTFGSFLYWIANFFLNAFGLFGEGLGSGVAFNLVYIASYLVIIFGVAIFLELVILNCCGLEVNTEFMIKKRAKEEEEFVMQQVTQFTKNDKPVLPSK